VLDSESEKESDHEFGEMTQRMMEAIESRSNAGGSR